MLGDYRNVLTTSSGGDSLYIHPLALAQLGREQEAVELLRERLLEGVPLPLRGNLEFSLALRTEEGRYREAAQAFLAAAGSRILGVRPM